MIITRLLTIQMVVMIIGWAPGGAAGAARRAAAGAAFRESC